MTQLRRSAAERNKMEENEKNREMKPEELKEVSGGNIIDDAYCLFGKHEWQTSPIGIKVNSTNTMQYNMYKCKHCSKKKYTKLDRATHKETSSSEKEYKAAP